MGKVTSNWSEEEILCLLSIWCEDEKNVLYRGEKESVKRERIYGKFLKESKYEERGERGVHEKMNRFKRWFRIINEYNREENPDNLLEKDWFQLSERKQDMILRERKLPYFNYSKQIYDKLAEFLDPNELPQYLDRPRIQHKQSHKNNQIKHRMNMSHSDGVTLNQLNTSQYADLLEFQANASQYTDTSMNLSKKFKCLSENLDQSQMPTFEGIFNELLNSHKQEMDNICDMVIKKHTELIKVEIAKYNDILCSNLSVKFKEKIASLMQENTNGLKEEQPDTSTNTDQNNVLSEKPEFSILNDF